MRNLYSFQSSSKKVVQLIPVLLLLLMCSSSYAGTKTWTGATSTDWATASNWSGNKVPAAGDDITIPVKPNMPVISTGTTVVHSIIIQSGASLTQAGGTLSVLGASVQITGIFNQSEGTMYADHDFKILAGGKVNQSGSSNIRMAKDAATNPAAKIIISAGGTVDQSGGTIYTKDYAASPGTFNQKGSTALFKVLHDWKPGAGSSFISTSGTVEFTGSGGGGPDFASGSRQFNNIIVDAGVDPVFGNVANTTVPISGNFTNSNTTLNNGTKATFTFNGSGNQTIYSAVTGTTNTTFGHLVINNTGGSVNLTSNANVSGNITLKSGTFDLSTYTANKASGTGTLTVAAGSTMRLAGTTGGQTGSNFPLRETVSLSTTSTVEYYGSGQPIYATPTYGNLSLTATGTKTATAALNVAGNFSLSAATFTAGSFTHNIGGSWTMNSGTFTNTGSTINFNGAGTQSIASTGAFNNVTINKASGASNITTDVTVAAALTFTKGILGTGSNKIILPLATSTIANATQLTGWVNGNLQKYFSATAGGKFDIGGALYYSPVTASFSGSFTAGSLIAKATAASQPNISTSTIASKNISRYWSLSKPASGAIAYNNATFGFNWNTADNYTSMATASLIVANYSSSSWNYPTIPNSPAPTATTITTSSVSTLGDFAVGEVSACTVSSGFSYPGAELCTNSGVNAITLNTGATAGTFTATPAGLSLNAATGAITTGTSSANTYVITNTVVVGSCTTTSKTSVKISIAPAASISYTSSTFCQSAGYANASITGATGGTFSSAFGLAIDDVTGQIDLGNSDAGTYTVTYTVQALLPCSATLATFTVTVTPANYANISYDQDAYCLNGGTAAVTLDGTTGGTYSASPSGLTLNAATGAITLSTSTPNTYTITYTGVASGGCAAFSGTTTIIITSTSPGTISYTGSPYCFGTGVASATITGQTGGTFSAAAGLDIDDISGDIDLTTSTPGTYTVTYSFGGCSATASVTVKAATTLSYAGAPFCGSVTAAENVTLSGVSGGTYSSTTGLTINTSNGQIIPSSSTPGDYQVTYAVPAAAGCAAYNTIYTVTIIAAQTATISYTGSPYCNTTGSTASVTLTGTSGGSFTSTAGLVIDAATGLVDLGASTGGTYTVTYTIDASAPCAQYQTTTTITVNTIGTWTGALSTTWNMTANWQCGVIPDNTINAIIPSGTPYYPVINAITESVKNLTIQSGALVTILNGKLQIAGTVTAGGNITATSGKVEFNGTTAQTIPAALFSSNALKELIITNAAGVTLGGAVRVTSTVSFGNVNNSVLNSNGYLTLVSTASNSANLADITNNGVNSGNQVSGNVVVERYIQGKRAYRFLTAPVNSTGSIKANWMENTNNASTSVNNNPNPGFGTHITGSGGNANGFDATSTNNASLFTFNAATQLWIAAPNTNSTFTPGAALRIMVRGSRSVDLNSNTATPSTTTLRATGTLVTGPVTFTAPGGGGIPTLTSAQGAYSLIGNPYASSVDWVSMLPNTRDISPTFYIYDPTISGSGGRGGYVSYNGVLKVKNILNSMVNKDIQCGQAFFVQTDSGSNLNPSIIFDERYKSSTFFPVFRSANDAPNINVQLFLPGQADSAVAADGTAVYFSDDFSNKIGADDSYKFTNLDENIAILRNGTALSLEGREPVTGSDSIPLKIWQLTLKSYTLKITVANFADNVESYLLDKYLKTTTPLVNGETLVPFSITSDAASGAANRFQIVFETLATLPVHLTSLKAYEKNKGVQVEWMAESESNMDLYEVERSADAQQFETIGSAKAKNNSGLVSAYSFFDVNPAAGNNFYRIKSVEKSGEVKLSEVVKVQVADARSTILVTNNPVEGTVIQLFFNNTEKGSYNLSLMNALGEQVYAGKVSYAGGTLLEEVNLSGHLPPGIYQMQISSSSIRKTVQILIK